MTLPAFTARTAPEWSGQISKIDDNWPSDRRPRLQGSPNLELPIYSLFLQPFGTSGFFGSYFRFFWIDRVVYPTTAPLSVGNYILFGEHRMGTQWDGVSPFSIGFGVSIEIKNGIAFAAAGASSMEWTFLGERRISPRSVAIDFQNNLGSNPPLSVISARRRSTEYRLADGSDRATIGQTALSLGFASEAVTAEVRGGMSLASALRRPLVLLPEFEPSTFLSVPMISGIEPDVGPSAKPRESYGDLIFSPTYYGARLQASALAVGMRRDFSFDLPGSVLEPEIINNFLPSDANGSSHDWGTLPSGSGNSTTIITGSSYGYAPFDLFGGVLLWRKGSDAQKLSKTFGGIATAGEVWVFSAYVRGAGSGGGLQITPGISGTTTNYVLGREDGYWNRIYAAGRQSGADVTVTLNLSIEGRVLEVCGCQLEKVGHYGRGYPSTLVPRFPNTGGNRKPSTLVYPKLWPADQGTWIVVFRMVDRGNGNSDNSLVPILSAYDTGFASYRFDLVCGRGTAEAAHQVFGYVNPAGIFVGSTTEDASVGDVIHLAIVATPADDSSNAKITTSVYLNGSAIGGMDDSSIRDAGILGDEIHVAPSSGLRSYFGVEMTPFAGSVEFIRLDSRPWNSDEIAAHAEKWTSDIGRDLVALTAGRRFDLRANYATVPGAERYALSSIRWNQIDALPRSSDPFHSFLT